MATVKIAYASSATITLTGTSLGTSATFIDGRQSDIVDNTSNLYDDCLVSGQTKTQTCTANTVILVYAWGLLNDTPTYPNNFGATDAALTIQSAGTGQGFLRLLAAMNVDSTTARSYWFGPVSLAAQFGGVVPRKWGIFMTHNTGANLSSTAGDHIFKFDGITYTVA